MGEERESRERACPRCEDISLLSVSRRGGALPLYCCPVCGGRYTEKEDGALVEPWPGSFGVLLYSIIFEKNPLGAVERTAEHFRQTKPWGPEEIRKVIAEVEDELRHPTQEVSRVLDLVHEPSEEIVRQYLRALIEELRNIDRDSES